jgi:hypothetical protein
MLIQIHYPKQKGVSVTAGTRFHHFEGDKAEVIRKIVKNEGLTRYLYHILK